MLDDRYDYGRDQCDSRDGHNTYNGFLRRIHTLDDFLCFGLVDVDHNDNRDGGDGVEEIDSGSSDDAITGRYERGVARIPLCCRTEGEHQLRRSTEQRIHYCADHYDGRVVSWEERESVANKGSIVQILAEQKDENWRERCTFQ